jgi:uncharacterized small protein (DUF1192 family)
MPSEALTLATDRVPDKKAKKRCTNCGHPKALDEFARNRTRKDLRSAQCLLCVRIARHEHYHEGGGKAVQAAYRARPEVRARIREYDRAQAARFKPGHVAYSKSPRKKVMACRSEALRKLGRAATDERRAALSARIALCDREIARLDAEHELPAEPPKARAARGTNSPCPGVYRTKAGTFEVKISAGTGQTARGGTFATLDEARSAANELVFKLRGERNYAVPREREAQP